MNGVAPLCPAGGIHGRVAIGRGAWNDGLPDRCHVAVLTDSLVSCDELRLMVPRRGDDDLVGRIAVKWLLETAALDQNRAGQLREMNSRHGCRGIEPRIERTVEDELVLFDFFRQFPDRDQRQPHLARALTCGNRRPRP